MAQPISHKDTLRRHSEKTPEKKAYSESETKTQKQMEILKIPPPKKEHSHFRQRSWSVEHRPKIKVTEKATESNKEKLVASPQISPHTPAKNLEKLEAASSSQSQMKIDRIYSKRIHMRRMNSENWSSSSPRITIHKEESVEKEKNATPKSLSPQQSKTPSLPLNLLKVVKSKATSPHVFQKSNPESSSGSRLLMRRTNSFQGGSQKIASPHTAEPLSLLSPPLSARRQFIPSSIMPSKKNTKDDIDLSSLTEVTDKKEMEAFDEVARQCMKIAWSSKQYPNVSSQIIQEYIEKACRKEIDELFNHEEVIDSGALRMTESPRTKQLIVFIQIGGIPLVQILERLKLIHIEIRKFMRLAKKKSSFTQLLYEYLDKLLETDTFSKTNAGIETGKDLAKFLSIVYEILRHKNRKLKKVILWGFGDTPKTKKQVLATLEKWSNPSLVQILELKKTVHALSWESLGAKSIPEVYHEWTENEHTQHPLRDVPVSEIIRCLKPHDYVIYSKILINKKVFYELNGEPQEQKDYEFYFQLLKSIYKAGFNKKTTDEEIKKQVKYLLEEHQPSHSEKLIKKCLPCIQLLQLTTHDSWLRADQCIRFLFPGLFSPPFWTKVVQGTECHIDIQSSTDFEVTLTKTYSVYYLQNPSDPTSTTPETSWTLASIPFAWTASPSPHSEQDDSPISESEASIEKHSKPTMQGLLHIIDHPKIDDKVSDDEKWKILRSLINFTDAELTFDAPESPRITSLALPVALEKFPKKK